jgi:hypothetical protein
VSGLDGLPKPVQPHIPILVGGGGKRVLSIAAREADIVGINGTMAAGAIGPEALASMTPDAVDEKVAIVKLAAGPRFESLEMNVRAFFVSVTDDREGLAARLAGGFGMTPQAALQTPFAVVGTVAQMVASRPRAPRALGVLLCDRRHRRRRAVRASGGRAHRQVSRTPSLAFAGAGWIAAVHGLAAKQLELPITRVASRHREKAKEMAARMGAIACSYDDLPAGADVVVVCSAPQCHAGHALHAIEAGAAVVIEKPLCTTLADADALAEAELAGARIGYAENLAYAPIVQQLLAAVADMGELQHLEVRTLQSRPTWGEFLTEAWGGGRCSTSASTRSPSRCWRRARRWCRSRRCSTAPTTIPPMSTPRSRSRSTAGSRPRGVELARR